VLNEEEEKMAKHDFWVHGLEAHVQNEPDPIATEAELLPGYTYPNPRRNSQGTRVRQNMGKNWFHFAIPTPIALQIEPRLKHHIELYEVLLRGTGNSCSIKALQVWSGGAGGGQKICDHNFPKPYRLDGDFDEKYSFTTPDWVWEAPLAIDVLIEFDEDGDITFGGAGVRFDVQPPKWIQLSRQVAPCLKTYA
jgi:hypothetical protein